MNKNLGTEEDSLQSNVKACFRAYLMLIEILIKPIKGGT